MSEGEMKQELRPFPFRECCTRSLFNRLVIGYCLKQRSSVASTAVPIVKRRSGKNGNVLFPNSPGECDVRKIDALNHGASRQRAREMRKEGIGDDSVEIGKDFSEIVFREPSAVTRA